MAPPDLTIRPLSLGEVIDWAVALTRRHFRVLFPLMILVQVPALLLYRWQTAGLMAMLEGVAQGGRPEVPPTEVLASSAVVLVVLPFLQLAASSAVALVVAPSLEGRPALPSLGATVRAFLHRAWPVASATALQMVVLGAAPVLGAIPGFLLAWRSSAVATRLVGISAALLGSVALLLAAVVRLSLAPAAAGVEGLAGGRALARSARLMAAGRGLSLEQRPGLKVSLLLLATFLLALAVNGLAGLPRAAAVVASGRGAMASLPLGAEVGLGIFEALASAAIQPFGLVALAVFYFDRRARREGLDLELWARRLGAQGTGP
ncbi:MAG TPA: hypothetical protein VFR85_00910 [Anaeromyxobacteraceae bacterium]|nr:hypothetical protein [Anaeromyxobacteraceae bacterium]